MAEETKALAPKESRIQQLLGTDGIRNRFESMLGKRAAAFTSSIISAVNSTPALLKCDPMTVISAAAVAAALDLPINPSLGFAHIVPYGNEAQFQIGWKGFIQLAMRTGQYKTINLTPVKEGQLKKVDPFTGEMEFVNEATSDKIVGYLLYFRLLNGYEKYFYMTKEQCHAHGKKYSAAFKKGFGRWIDDFDSMAIKTVAKLGLSKYGILSVDMQQAIEFDQAAVGPDGRPNYIDVPAEDVTEQPAKKEVGPKKTRAQQAVEDSKKEDPKKQPESQVHEAEVVEKEKLAEADKI